MPALWVKMANCQCYYQLAYVCVCYGDPLSAGQEGIHPKVKAWKVAKVRVATFNCKFFEYFEGFSEYGIFHGIIICHKSKPLKRKEKNTLFTIEWE